MTKRELINLLNDPAKQIPDDAVICAFDPEAESLLPLTGMVYGPDLRVGFSVELCTDPLDEVSAFEEAT